jgi:hypothetical protein
MRTPDGHGRIELSRFLTPPAVEDHRNAPVNALGYLRVMFAVDKAAGGFFKNIELLSTRRSAKVLDTGAVFLAPFIGSGAGFGQGSCGSLGITLSPDYQFAFHK